MHEAKMTEVLKKVTQDLDKAKEEIEGLKKRPVCLCCQSFPPMVRSDAYPSTYPGGLPPIVTCQDMSQRYPEGAVIVRNGEKRKVLGRAGSVVFLSVSMTCELASANFHTESELANLGWTVEEEALQAAIHVKKAYKGV